MRKKYKELTRDEYKYGLQKPPFNYSGYFLERAMKSYDDSIEFRKIHPNVLPADMHQVSLSGYSNDTIDDTITMHCDCDEEFTISGGYLTFCPKCGKGYRVISYIAQYDKI